MGDDVTADVTTANDLTREAVDSVEHTADPRLRELVRGLIRHLHAFAIEQALTEAELMASIRFLTEVGQTCTDRRQEFILLSDTLGVSMLVDLINHDAAGSATESTVLGPFYVEDAPWRSNGDAITDDLGAQPLLVSGHVRDTDGSPVAGATVDVWQNATNRLYAVQDDAQPPDNLRGRFRTDDAGAFAFRTVRPVDYPIPDGRSGRQDARGDWTASMAAGAHPLHGVRRRVRQGDDPHLQLGEPVPGIGRRVRRQTVAHPSVRRARSLNRASAGWNRRTLVHGRRRHRAATIASASLG